MKMKNKRYIGIGGVARVGKNLFYDIANDILKKEYNLTSKAHALAYYLKRDCEEFVKEKLGLSVWSENTADKDIFRPLLVWYGGVKRKQTNGRYWVEMLQKDLEKSDAEINFITDIRYVMYDKDEVFWLRNELNGKLVHITKFTMVDETINKFDKPNIVKKYVEPANEHELVNDPILKKWSDVSIEWQDIGSGGKKSYNELINDPYLREVVGEVLKTLFK